MMNVMHIIDSSELGGAERVAVSLVNGLISRGINSHICVARKEGPLTKLIDDKVGYTFLKKRHTFDISAMIKLFRYCRTNNIEILHAHSSSFFIAVIIKFFLKIKVIWHNHNGDSRNISTRNLFILRLLKRYFDYVVVVSHNLKRWSLETLHFNDKKTSFLNNYPDLSNALSEIDLPGEKGKRITCLANLRPIKDHKTLIQSMEIICERYPDWHLLLVGKDFNDSYSKEIRQLVHDSIFQNNIHVMGSQTKVAQILNVSDIGVLSSLNEGLPVSLLEYGLAGLPVVATAVGEIPIVLNGGEYGVLVPSSDPQRFARAIGEMIENPTVADEFAERFKKYVQERYSKDACLLKLENIYNSL